MMTAFQINVTKTITINRIKRSSIEVLIKRGSEKDNKTIRIFFKIISSTNRCIGNPNLHIELSPENIPVSTKNMRLVELALTKIQLPPDIP